MTTWSEEKGAGRTVDAVSRDGIVAADAVPACRFRMAATTRERGEPRIPLAVVDAPTQRFYAAAVFVGVQAWKWTRIVALHWLHKAPVRGLGRSIEPTTLFSALLLDFALCYGIYWLAIPPRAPAVGAGIAAPPPTRRRGRRWYVVVFLLLAVLDVLSILQREALVRIATLAPGPAVWSVGERRVRLDHVVEPRAHIAGQHTVHIVPYGTARIDTSVSGTCMCLDERVRQVHIPIVLNQTSPPVSLTYSITDPATGHVTRHTIKHPKTSVYTKLADAEPDVPHGAKTLSLAERRRARRAARGAADVRDPVTVHYLRLEQTGLVRLESVLDRQSQAAHIVSEAITLVECPRASFVSAASDYCVGDEAQWQVMLHGTPPLTLTYAHARGERSLVHHTPGAPATIALDVPAAGAHALQLRHVRDVCGNVAYLNETSTAYVHAQAQVHWDAKQCVPGRPLKLLRTSDGLSLRVAVEMDESWDDKWDVEYVHRRDDREAVHSTRPLSRGTHAIHVRETGVYTLQSAASPHCVGRVSAPWTCEVVDVPPPRASIHFESIDDACAGTVGVKALSDLEGEPPFRLVYETQRDGAPTRHERIVRDQTRDELEFWPSTEGRVTYRFLELHDANYAHVPLDGPSFTHVAHPLATASFVGAERDHDAVVSSCGEPSVQADVAFTGHGPYTLEYAIRGAGAKEPVLHTLSHITESRATLAITLPPGHDAGRATVSLLSLRDGRGCVRRLATRDLRIDVRPPTAAVSFAAPWNVTLQEHEPAVLPLRLRGAPPWTVAYTRDGVVNGTVTLHDANEALTVHEPGTYTLTGVRDAHCSGQVVQDDTAQVVMRPRPQARFVGEAPTGIVALPPVCVHTPLEATIALQGHPPVHVKVQRTLLTDQGDTRVYAQTLASSEAHVSLPLGTRVPGTYMYHIMGTSDAYYADARPDTKALEYRVWPQPQAAWAPATPARRSACLGDTWAQAPTLQLHGTPPFRVDIEARPVHTEGHADAMRFTHTVHGTQWAVALPAPFQVPGTWEVRVLRVEDAHCRQDGTQPPPVVVDVVESAGVVAPTTREHYCVGERMDFVLQGTPPWTVTYTFDGATSRVTSRRAEFWRMADRPGVLRVLGAAHRTNACRQTHAPLERIVHALPSAHISAGQHHIESLHEGAQTEIVFQLRGEPPFSFTYQRTEPADTHARPRVLETHTVEAWHANEYRVPTSQEGTWSVVWMQDQWCQVSLGQVSGPAQWP